MDAPHDVRLSTSPDGVLIVVGGALAVEGKNGENGKNRSRLGP